MGAAGIGKACMAAAMGTYRTRMADKALVTFISSIGKHTYTEVAPAVYVTAQWGLGNVERAIVKTHISVIDVGKMREEGQMWAHYFLIE